MFCPLHSSISKKQHEKHLCNPSSHYGKFTCETCPPYLHVTWSDKKAYLQVLRHNSFTVLSVVAYQWKQLHAYDFTLFKPASYLQYHPEYKKPATKFPAILDSFLTEVHWGSTVSGEPHRGGGGKTRVCFK